MRLSYTKETSKTMFDKLKIYFGGKTPTGPVDAIVCGLGNPGKEYENTRHNAGFLALDRIADLCGVKVDRMKFSSLCNDAVICDKRVLLLKPQTYMNKSGEALSEAARFYKVKPENIIVLFDDISLPPGKLRIRRKGSDGGHNGIKDILYHLGTDAFPRIKIGVGQKPRPDYDLAAWVLGKFPPDDKKAVDEAIEKAGEAVKLLLDGDVDRAMNLYN